VLLNIITLVITNSQRWCFCGPSCSTCSYCVIHVSISSNFCLCSFCAHL